jgi:hypothetical protein
MTRRMLVALLALAVGATALAMLGVILASRHPALLVAGAASALYPALEAASHSTPRTRGPHSGYPPLGDPWRSQNRW